MEPQTKVKVSAKDVFLNLGATIALYTVVVSLVNLLFTIINTAFPKVGTNSSLGSASISWPVATLVVFFPVFILIMWVLGKQYEMEPERRSAGIHKWLTYLTLFLAGIAMAVDLIAILYYFIDGQELTKGFVLKVLALLIIAFSIFSYYLADTQSKLTKNLRNLWRVASTIAIIGSIVWGFAVLGSPYTQRMYKYDSQKLNDLMSINNEVTNYYAINGKLPQNLAEISQNYFIPLNDSQTNKPYEYQKVNLVEYKLCADFNKASSESDKRAYYWGGSWIHEAGHYCFAQKINPNMYDKGYPAR